MSNSTQMKRFLKPLIHRLRTQLTDSSSALNRFSPPVIELVQTVRHKNLTFLSEKKLARLAKLCEIAVQANSNGLFIEAGCALGGSAVLLA
jgi:hypothetical protein